MVKRVIPLIGEEKHHVPVKIPTTLKGRFAISSPIWVKKVYAST